MPPRKFFYGDVVKFRRAANDGTPLRRYQKHIDHTATLIHTKILTREPGEDNARWPRVVYTVACECGKRVRPQAAFLNLVRKDYESSSAPSIGKQRMLNFLAKFPGEQRGNGVRASSTAGERIEDILSCLEEREKYILITRHGLYDDWESPVRWPGMTYREIGESLNLSRERIRQIEYGAMRKLHAN
jgi:RNA polymerase sigma factor (sigma-70 family)